MQDSTTKKAMVEAFFALASNRPADKISVRDVCREAGVSTVTFYNHFANKAEMYVWASRVFGERALARLGRDGYSWEDYLRDSLDLNLAARGFLPNVVSNTHGHQSFSNMVYRAAVELLSANIAERQPGHPDARELVVLRTYVHGMVDMVEEWVTGGMDEGYAGLVVGLCEAFPASLAAYVPVWHEDD